MTTREVLVAAEGLDIEAIEAHCADWLNNWSRMASNTRLIFALNDIANLIVEVRRLRAIAAQPDAEVGDA